MALAEVHALGQRRLGGVVDGVGGAAHVGLPGVRPRLPAAAGLLLAAERAADLGAGGADVDVGDAESDPSMKRSASRISLVKIADERPWGTALLIAIASSRSS